MKKQIGNIIDLFYPRTCRVCGRMLLTHEEFLCLHCIHNIPRTDFHKKESHPMEQLFRGKIDIQDAYAFFYFTQHGDYRRLIHNIKYKGEKRCGKYLGRLFASELLKEGKLSLPFRYTAAENVPEDIIKANGSLKALPMLQGKRYTLIYYVEEKKTKAKPINRSMNVG